VRGELSWACRRGIVNIDEGQWQNGMRGKFKREKFINGVVVWAQLGKISISLAVC